MNRFKNMLQRTTPQYLVEYLLTGSIPEEIESHTAYEEKEFDTTYEERVSTASEHFFDFLERTFPDINRENEEFMTAFNNFFSDVTDAYTEVGLLIGIQLFKNLEKARRKFEDKPNFSDED